MNGIPNPETGAAIAIRTVNTGTPSIFGRIVQEPAGFADNSIWLGSDEFRRGGFYGLRPLGLVAQHQGWFTERGRFLLHAA